MATESKTEKKFDGRAFVMRMVEAKRIFLKDPGGKDTIKKIESLGFKVVRFR